MDRSRQNYSFTFKDQWLKGFLYVVSLSTEVAYGQEEGVWVPSKKDAYGKERVQTDTHYKITFRSLWIQAIIWEVLKNDKDCVLSQEIIHSLNIRGVLQNGSNIASPHHHKNRTLEAWKHINSVQKAWRQEEGLCREKQNHPDIFWKNSDKSQAWKHQLQTWLILINGTIIRGSFPFFLFLFLALIFKKTFEISDTDHKPYQNN